MSSISSTAPKASVSAADSTPKYGSRSRPNFPNFITRRFIRIRLDRPPGANITSSTKNTPRYNCQAFVNSDSATAKITNTIAPRIGPKKNVTPPMKAASSTPPDRIACTFSALTISKLMAVRPPAMPAKKLDRISISQRTRCVL